jgi:hypothetical protein
MVNAQRWLLGSTLSDFRNYPGFLLHLPSSHCEPSPTCSGSSCLDISPTRHPLRIATNPESLCSTVMKTTQAKKIHDKTGARMLCGSESSHSKKVTSNLARMMIQQEHFTKLSLDCNLAVSWNLIILKLFDFLVSCLHL